MLREVIKEEDVQPPFRSAYNGPGATHPLSQLVSVTVLWMLLSFSVHRFHNRLNAVDRGPNAMPLDVRHIALELRSGCAENPDI